MTNHIEIAGVTVNGQPLVVALESELAFDHGCDCRRCLIHDDPGGCLRQ